MRLTNLIILFLTTLLSTFGQNVNFPTREIHLPDNIDSANCVIYPDGNRWDVKIGWSSEPIISNLNIPLVGDLNDDGIPEIVCWTKNGDITAHPYRYNNEFIVFDGFTKHVKALITLPEDQKITANDGAAYGLVKLRDRKGLIIVACGDYYLRAYDISKTNPEEPYWVSDEPYGSGFASWAVNVSFADFNSDGIPEVYVRNKIYNAETGKLLAQADSPNTGSSFGHWSHQKHYKLSSPLAANVLGDDNLELILGNRIFSVDITNPDGQSSNSITEVKYLTPPEGAVEDGHAQVADFNKDGYLDVFISIRDTDESVGTIYGYVWDVHNDVVSEPFSISTEASGKSIPFIGDIDNDDLMEVIIQCGPEHGSNTSHDYIAVRTFKYNPTTRTFSFMWEINVKENSFSNGITAFDFNQDGLLELIICDEEKLRIVNGSGKSHITHNDTVPFYIMETFPYEEITIMQYPVIVDADDDGMAEIVSVGSDKLNFIESDGGLWAPTRKVWNQYMYNVTNVNNDLTVTQYHFNNATPFVDPDDGGVLYPFNNFLQQATTIDKYGHPFFAATDAAVTDMVFEGFILYVHYSNEGDKPLYAPYNITVYANEYGGEILKNHLVNSTLQVGENKVGFISLNKDALCGNRSLKNIVVALNCSGIGIAQNGGNQMECDTTNNIGIFDFSGYSSASDTIITNKTTCSSYEWFDSTYVNSGSYIHIVENDETCDSIFKLNLTVKDSLALDIQGVKLVTVASNLWPGIYKYCVADSLDLVDCELTWTCSDPEWSFLPSDNKYWCKIIAADIGEVTLTVHASCENGCDNENSINIYASHIYDVDENHEPKVVIYPNPAQTRFTVQGNMITRIMLFDTSGQKVEDLGFETTDIAHVDVQKLQHGMYIVEITTLEGKVREKVFVY